MRIRVLRNFASYKAGQEFDWGDGMARVMIARGLIEQVVDEPQTDDEIEQATTAPQVEQAIHHQRRKRR